MKTTLRQSLTSGAVFGVIHIFLVLIGFNTLIGTLLSRLVGSSFSGDIPPAGSLVVYTVLLAVLGGWSAAGKSPDKSTPKISPRTTSAKAPIPPPMTPLVPPDMPRLSSTLSLCLLPLYFIIYFLVVI